MNISDKKLAATDALILNSASAGFFPIDCFFRSEKEYELCFGEKWHGLSLPDCWLAIADLLALGLVELVRYSKPNPSATQFAREATCLGLTHEGGVSWEREFDVKWHDFIEVEGDMDAENGYSFKATNRNILNSMLQRIGDSGHARLLQPSAVLSCGHWNPTNWKSFEESYCLSVLVTGGSALKDNIPFVEDTLFGISRDLSKHFKTIWRLVPGSAPKQ
jgi:hypothetical protein